MKQNKALTRDQAIFLMKLNNLRAANTEDTGKIIALGEQNLKLAAEVFPKTYAKLDHK